MSESSPYGIQELRGRIESLISNSERLFLAFGSTFPTFVRELHRSLEASRRSLLSIGAGASIEAAMQDLFSSTRETIERAAVQFTQMHEKDNVLLESLNATIDTLNNLDAVISKIRDDSVEMELISLNAMTVALKSGHAGKAFSVITDELKRLSSRTIQLTDQLTLDGRTLLGHFSSYREEIRKLEATQSALFEGLSQRVHGRFQDLEVRLRGIGSSLESLVDESRKVEGPVQAIMETVQLQDIIRQSLDHVLMALEELRSPKDEGPVAPADLAAFKKTLAALSDSILQDVRASLDGARHTFQVEAATIRSVIAKGEKRRRALLDESFGSGGAGLASSSFAETSMMLVEIGGHVDAYIHLKRSLAGNGARLSESVEGLDRRFKAFEKILNRFRTIDVACRIEVSKQAVLRSINDTVTEMSALIDRIAADVDEAVSITQAFIGSTRSAVSAYADTSLGEAEIFDSAESGLRQSHESLGLLKDSIQGGIRNFSLFTADFVQLLAGGAKDIEGIDGILAECAAISAALRAVAAEAEAELEALGVGRAYTDVHSRRLKDIIGRFTIYAHKRAAAELGGLDGSGSDFALSAEPDAGVEAGEVTFF